RIRTPQKRKENLRNRRALEKRTNVTTKFLSANVNDLLNFNFHFAKVITLFQNILFCLFFRKSDPLLSSFNDNFELFPVTVVWAGW
ncbi:MAG: hypothetical protein ACE5FR_01735, partial [Rhodospirillales bacterium]